jgi:tetratricopeptide (TPR) repeat protein
VVGIRNIIVRLFLGLLLATSTSVAASRLDDSLELLAKGKLEESRETLRGAIRELHASGDLRGLSRALSAMASISVSLGDYTGAIQNATEAIAVLASLKDDATISPNFTTLGLANLYLGQYSEALGNYQKALKLDRQHHRTENEVTLENDIGNVFYFQGRYQDALRAYQDAVSEISAAGEQSWVPKRRQLTIANLAVLYQRLGKDQTALEFYRQLTGKPQALPKTEYAQLLMNEGVLYRRMGDPVKALEQYRAAQAIFATEHHRAAEIGAFRNIGIARAVDLNDLDGARDAFTIAFSLSRESSDTRGIVQAALHRGEVFRRLRQTSAAESDFRLALSGAQKIGLTEEQWKAQYGLGKLAEDAGDLEVAAAFYLKAIEGIESMRAGMRTASLRSEFLADKRDVYDALIGLRLRQPEPPLGNIFSLMERSRARALEDLSRSAPAKNPTLAEVEANVPQDTVFVELWAGNEKGAALWITHTSAGILMHSSPPEALQNSIAEFERSIIEGDERWKGLARQLGTELLAGVPDVRHVIVAPDGLFAELPFEMLTAPRSGAMLIENCDVSYVPAGRSLVQAGVPAARRNRRLIPPWYTQLIAFGAPPISGEDAFASNDRWQPIAGAEDEIRSIAELLPGRSEIYLGPAARKSDLLSRPLTGVSLLHFSTHAVVDADNPDRSRILMASGSAAAPFDYLFLREVYGMNLIGVDLVTISACETARGKFVRGDGVQAFSQAFLAAGAAATVTSLWRVADQPTAEFMKQFYYFLARGQSKSGALRSAKLRFLHSNSAWSAPRYWSAFVLNGDGGEPCTRVIPWSWFIGALGGTGLIGGLWIRRIRASSTPGRTE